MENPFFSEYFKFAKNIKKANYITAVINTDYNENNISLLIDKQSAYKQSVEELLTYASTLSSISNEERRQMAKLISKVNNKATSIDRTRISSLEIYNHYFSLLNATDISFIVVFKSGDCWNVNFTTSLRSDRRDTHSNRFINSIASKNYLVVCSYPYQDTASIKCINEIKRNPTAYGGINVVCLEEFMDELLFNIFRYKEGPFGELIAPKPKDELSIVNGERGVQIEHMYAAILNNHKNWELYLSDTSETDCEKTENSFLPNHYKYIMQRILSDYNLRINQIQSISACHTGSAGEKADVMLTIRLSDDSAENIDIGISIKSSSSDNVSVHEKHASDFISVLGITDTNLQNAFIQFEERRALNKLDKNLYTALSDYYIEDTHKRELLEWAIAGEASNPLKADYVLLHSYNYNTKEASGLGIKLYSSQEYIDALMESDLDGTFGTHLTWTYKGNIQLKAPFIFE